jgi:hypothetical protein
MTKTGCTTGIFFFLQLFLGKTGDIFFVSSWIQVSVCKGWLLTMSEPPTSIFEQHILFSALFLLLTVYVLYLFWLIRLKDFINDVGFLHMHWKIYLAYICIIYLNQSSHDQICSFSCRKLLFIWWESQWEPSGFSLGLRTIYVFSLGLRTI